ncbi:MAG: VOC family protein [Proteobacteria bacterium]|nr:VOC family protein [Pseudomonadota bacterium]
MRYLHTMVRVLDLEKSLDFYVNKLGLKLIRRTDYEKGRYTLVFVATGPNEPSIELTHNWDQNEPYTVGRNFGHIAYEVENIYEYCEALQRKGITILRPPRDGRMAFIRSPDNVSIELLQKGEALAPQEPWVSMQNTGEW